MKDLTTEEAALVKQGALAELAIQSPAIASAINELSEEFANQILATKLDELAKREEFYRLHVALKEVVVKLSHRIAIKQNIEAHLADQENE